MICPNCQYENEESAKYCIECGTKLVEENKEDVNEVEEPIQETVNQGHTKDESKEWYYVVHKESVGPFSEEEMQEKIRLHTITENTYVWKEGMQDWTLLRDTAFIRGLKNWYYAHHEESIGPFTQEEMEGMIQSHEITGNTYVWKEGMKDWILLKNSMLVQPMIPASSKKNIVLQVVLTVLTAGIYKLFWYYSLAKSINHLLEGQDQREAFQPGMVVFLSIITFGLYGIYFFWKAGKSVSCLQFENVRVDDDSTLLAVVAIFTSIVSCAILQNTINELLENEN